MSSFKDSVARDIDMVFLNGDEFAEPRTIVCEGMTYEGVMCVVTKPLEKRRFSAETGFASASSYRAAGMYKQAMRVSYRADALPVLPEQGSVIRMDAAADGDYLREWTVKEAKVTMGMARLTLEAVSE